MKKKIISFLMVMVICLTMPGCFDMAPVEVRLRQQIFIMQNRCIINNINNKACHICGMSFFRIKIITLISGQFLCIFKNICYNDLVV